MVHQEYRFYSYVTTMAWGGFIGKIFRPCAIGFQVMVSPATYLSREWSKTQVPLSDKIKSLPSARKVKSWIIVFLLLFSDFKNSIILDFKVQGFKISRFQVSIFEDFKISRLQDCKISRLILKSWILKSWTLKIQDFKISKFQDFKISRPQYLNI